MSEWQQSSRRFWNATTAGGTEMDILESDGSYFVTLTIKVKKQYVYRSLVQAQRRAEHWAAHYDKRREP